MNNLSHPDLTFITNEEGQSLQNRFEQLIKDSRYFDCLVAYFYLSGFHAIYKSLEKTEKIRILIGIGTSQQTYDLIQESQQENLSHYETTELTSKMIEDELAESEDKPEVEDGVQKFIDWLKKGKIEIRAYPSRDIHAKLYIMTFKEGDRDVGRVITGSSNFTKAGFRDNLEFNVELKNRADYDFARQKFNELWENSVDVSENFVQTINEKTWLNENIKPYDLYLKLLYEYFKDELSRTNELKEKYLPENFKEFEYQKQAVLNAKKILEEYGGVFISDVVGLGKTYMGALLASELDGRTMVIAPPALLNHNNPGSWPNVFDDFRISAKFFSVGKLNEAKRELEKREYKNIIIDESHRFRNETTLSYEVLAEICRGKRVILVSATPYNNSPLDILSQIKLFQNTRYSTIPGTSDIEAFFTGLQSKLKNIDRKNNYEEYLKTSVQNAKEIREKILKYIMIRRIRTEIDKYYKDDLERNNIKFPEVKDPKPFYYQFNSEEDKIFTKSINWLTQNFSYARYTPLLYLKSEITQLEKQSQQNMGGFMKVLLVKRLESSFYAFKKSIDRFIYSYEMFIKEYKKGVVYISKKYSNKIFELLEEGNDDEIQKLIDEGKAESYNSSDFKEDFITDLNRDLELLKAIKKDWDTITRDPKIETLIKNLKENSDLKNKKILIFTESKETAEYLTANVTTQLGNIALLFHGQSSEIIKNQVIENFDARVKNKKDDFRILITTDVLAEGVNLHRSNIVINYDIPWNPTKIMQRVGRVNRIDTPHDEIYTFNFFPTIQSDSEIELTNIARSKIEAFLNLLGGDASILTEGEPVESHELFDRLISKKTITGDEEEESELKYLKIIEEIRDNKPDLFERIKRLPKKARSAKSFSEGYSEIASSSFLITFFRRGKLMKFFYSTNKNEVTELDFLTTVKVFESTLNEEKVSIPLKEYYELLDKNKTYFFNTPIEELSLDKSRKGSNNINKLLKIIKATQQNSKQLTEDQEQYFKILAKKLEEGAIPKRTVKNTLQELENLGREIQNPLKVIAILQTNISSLFLKEHYAEVSNIPEGKREIILNLFVNKI
ncbi:MAG: RNA polymerase-associated protein RapA [Spirochaetes bacterium ADurb.Bin218]|jgi:superfamily II DNA/RNA helicase|nr:MAG: RNA polymerase-associated protein RapA [Spirochaetes bacterium ADurb.Bin218]